METRMEKDKNNSSAGSVQILPFGFRTAEDRRLLRRFVDFHWVHYAGDGQYIPLLDYEYLGFKLLGIRGFFEPSNLFFKHADMRLFLATRDGRTVGRCNAFVNHNHNRHWKDKVGFFGQFECIDDAGVCSALVRAAGNWLAERGMAIMRGPQNLPVNEATPGILTAGFDSRPVMYYHYSKPYYESLLRRAGFKPVKRVLSWEVPVDNPMDEKLVRLPQKIIDRFQVAIEPWGKRPLEERKREMLEVYNDAWSDNYGFVPFERDEFKRIVDDMQLIMDKDLFLFVYVKGELAAFFGGVPNVTEKMKPIPGLRRAELLRAAKMLLGKGGVKGFRLGYLGVKKKFRNLGLDGVMLSKQKQYAQKKGYEYCDMGWVLEDNVRTISLVERFGAKSSKTYTIFEKPAG
jgi:ribosomal protein S18 acetylase RimI-like enzyme